jgi:glycerophosphoryl diester phosphodiesterase
VQQRLPSLRAVPVAFGHRGASAHAPENTLDAFGLALRLGANGIESDCWLTADGTAVLDHDGVVRRRLRNIPLSTVSRNELPGHVPALDDVFAELGTNFHLSLDVKDPAATVAIGIAVAASGFDPANLWLCSPSLDVLEMCAASAPGAHLVHSTRLSRLGTSLELHCARLAAGGIDTVNLHHTEWTGGQAVLCHRFGLNAFGWDLQHEDPMTNALRMGLDGVYSDRVDMMVEAYAREVGKPMLPVTVP